MLILTVLLIYWFNTITWVENERSKCGGNIRFLLSAFSNVLLLVLLLHQSSQISYCVCTCVYVQVFLHINLYQVKAETCWGKHLFAWVQFSSEEERDLPNIQVWTQTPLSASGYRAAFLIESTSLHAYALNNNIFMEVRQRRLNLLTEIRRPS